MERPVRIHNPFRNSISGSNVSITSTSASASPAEEEGKGVLLRNLVLHLGLGQIVSSRWLLLYAWLCFVMLFAVVEFIARDDGGGRERKEEPYAGLSTTGGTYRFQDDAE